MMFRPSATNDAGLDIDPVAPVRMSCTSFVLRAVPPVRQARGPPPAVVAPKMTPSVQNVVALANPLGFDDAAPALMSLRSTVPAKVPSDFQSSLPFVPSFAANNAIPFQMWRLAGLDPLAPERMSFTKDIDDPSYFQSSAPFVPSFAEKSSVEASKTFKYEGDEDALPALRFETMSVPADVPSDFHNSVPSAVVAVNTSSPLNAVRFSGVELLTTGGIVAVDPA
jgi:hypothetical protein